MIETGIWSVSYWRCPEVVYHALDLIISFEFDYSTLCCKMCGYERVNCGDLDAICIPSTAEEDVV